MKNILSTILLLILCLSINAEVTVKKEDHMQNMDPGRCAWCALETLGRTHGWDSLKGLVERNARAATREDIFSELNKAKVKYRAHLPREGEYFYYLWYTESNESTPKVVSVHRDKQEATDALSNARIEGQWWVERRIHWNTKPIRDAVTKDLGCAVSIDHLDQNMKPARHLFVVTHFNNQRVIVVDSNDPQGKMRTIPVEIFLHQFNGFVIVIEKK